MPGDLDGARLDRAVSVLFDVPVAAARRLVAARRVLVDERRRRKGDTVRAGQTVLVEGPGRWLAPAPDPRLRVLFNDAELIVVDKPAGVPCHPLIPGEGGTVVDALAALFPEIERASPEAPREAGLVHRLDTGTSGCLAVARSEKAWRELRAAFATDAVLKRYQALVHGQVVGERVVEARVAHDPADPRRMRVDPAGRPATSVVRALVSGADVSLVEVVMHGGRRHQLRVHLASLGHPIVGDALYGAPRAADMVWPLLHARSLELPGRARVQAPLPAALFAAAAARGLAVEAEAP
ncbi:MAG: hypothetical protein A2138_14545 [Deltaproteobacteria bacterium RBG_16_71_12]|nr:MAG: hypothetical protein A2138_14545 [Deltaproteobacteria bacterium RBG_16_71_12]